MKKKIIITIGLLVVISIILTGCASNSIPSFSTMVGLNEITKKEVKDCELKDVTITEGDTSTTYRGIKLSEFLTAAGEPICENASIITYDEDITYITNAEILNEDTIFAFYKDGKKYEKNPWIVIANGTSYKVVKNVAGISVNGIEIGDIEGFYESGMFVNMELTEKETDQIDVTGVNFTINGELVSNDTLKELTPYKVATSFHTREGFEYHSYIGYRMDDLLCQKGVNIMESSITVIKADGTTQTIDDPIILTGDTLLVYKEDGNFYPNRTVSIVPLLTADGDEIISDVVGITIVENNPSIVENTPSVEEVIEQ